MASQTKAITKQDVYDAINQLLEESGRYTNQAIIDLIGGSSVTVQKYRKEYEREHRDEIKKKVLMLKDSEQKAIADSVAEIITGRVAEVSDSYTAEVERLSDELEKTLSDKENLVEENNEQLKEIKQLTDENLDLKAKLKFLEEEHAGSKAEIIEEYEKHKSNISEQLEIVKKQYADAVNEYKNSNIELKNERDELQKQLNESSTNERIASIRLEESEKTVKRYEAEINQLKQDLRDQINNK